MQEELYEVEEEEKNDEELNGPANGVNNEDNSSF